MMMMMVAGLAVGVVVVVVVGKALWGWWEVALEVEVVWMVRECRGRELGCPWFLW